MTTKNNCMNMICKQCNHIFVRNFILPRSVEDVILDIQMLDSDATIQGTISVNTAVH